jgi:hypothetical protein
MISYFRENMIFSLAKSLGKCGLIVFCENCKRWKIVADIFAKMEMLRRFSRKVSRILSHLTNVREI